MEGEDERKSNLFFTPKLSLLNIPLPAANMQSPLCSGLETPPLQTLASVPFKWEEEPGKPRPCTDLITLPELAKCLELPPCRMAFMEPTNKITKTRTPSPTTVLDGPHNVGRPKFSSFRFFREAQDTFDSCSSASPDSESAVDVFLGNKSGGQKAIGFFGRTLKWKGVKKEVNGFSSSSNTNTNTNTNTNINTSCDSDEKVKIEGKMRRNGSFSSVSHAKSTHLWASIYQGLKQVMPWKSARKQKKEGPV